MEEASVFGEVSRSAYYANIPPTETVSSGERPAGAAGGGVSRVDRIADVIGAKDTRAVDCLIEGELLSSDSEQRLRCAYQVATILSAYDSPHIAQAWLMGLNPGLCDRVLVVCQPALESLESDLPRGWANLNRQSGPNHGSSVHLVILSSAIAWV
jgi:hypothetical protein